MITEFSIRGFGEYSTVSEAGDQEFTGLGGGIKSHFEEASQGGSAATGYCASSNANGFAHNVRASKQRGWASFFPDLV